MIKVQFDCIIMCHRKNISIQLYIYLVTRTSAQEEIMINLDYEVLVVISYVLNDVINYHYIFSKIKTIMDQYCSINNDIISKVTVVKNNHSHY